MNFTEQQVIQFEILADSLRNFENLNDDLGSKFLIMILNIESLLPSSNIFDYVVKKDNFKGELDKIDEDMWTLKNQLSDARVQTENEIWLLKNKLSDLEVEIDKKMWDLKNRISDIHNEIDESEWKVELESTEEIIFNEIKQKLVIEKKLNYGNI